MSDKLIHFTKGDDEESAYQNLRSIIAQRTIWGSHNLIKGAHVCVCFSEAPLASLQNGLQNSDFYSKYSLFGILTSKEHVFSLGGRPVIYQPDSEYGQLTCENNWRHMRYEPPQTDLSWEREWRLKTEGFQLEASVTAIIVPDTDWEQRLIADDEKHQRWQTMQYSQIMEETLAVQYEESFPWTVIPLNSP
jgi:hypothetical protein